ncbi:MAG: DegT/DnrJ/EryC1/StrS family aminotransferase [Mycobacteriales bacterium]
MSAEGVPLVDLGLQHAQVADRVARGFAEVIASGAYVGGPDVEAFEREYAQLVGVRHCIGVGNGTDAIELALRACGVGTGDEVILPANTFVATAEAVVRAGAVPVLADVDADCLLLDPDAAAAAVGPATRALVPVHLFGQTAPVERLAQLVADNGLVLVEDAAQSQGALRHGRPAGSFGLASATSFFPGKNLGAYGDAGAVMTDDHDVARRVRLLGSHGSAVKYHHEELGFNSRLDTLQAVVLRCKLERLSAWNEQRRAAAARYDALLRDLPEVRVPGRLGGNVDVWHLYVVRVPDRDALLRRLNEAGIGAGVHYPVPVHLQQAFCALGRGAGSFPVAEAAAKEILSLPLFPGITPAQQERVVHELRRGLRS